MTRLEQALERFRESWRKYPQEFVLKFYCPGRGGNEFPLVPKGELKLSSIRLPFERKPDSRFTLTGTINALNGQVSEQAINEFKECCIDAGAALSGKYFDEYTKPYVDGNFLAGFPGPEAHFFAIMANHKKFVIHEDEQDYRKAQEVHLVTSPWQESISLLELIIAEQSAMASLDTSTGSSVQNPDKKTPDVLATIRDNLRGNSLNIFDLLRGQKHAISYETLREKIWRDNVVYDSAITKALERLKKKLSDLTAPFDIEVSKRNGRAKFIDLRTKKPT